MIIMILFCVFTVASMCLFAAFFYSEKSDSPKPEDLDEVQKAIIKNFGPLSQNKEGHLVNDKGDVLFRCDTRNNVHFAPSIIEKITVINGDGKVTSIVHKKSAAQEAYETLQKISETRHPSGPGVRPVKTVRISK